MASCREVDLRDTLSHLSMIQSSTIEATGSFVARRIGSHDGLPEGIMEIVEIVNAEQKSSAVADIIKTLPEWFGIPASNEHYIKEPTSKDVFAAYDNLNQSVGLIALRYHFQTTAEIWWDGCQARIPPTRNWDAVI
jgi:hypothetical protein